ncbi:unnamed protein product [Amoebophrya sp. A25]|nr:unnamed protein product [Amoebophrya sp. A25]|eukprot:GSA25T00014818001.1
MAPSIVRRFSLPAAAVLMISTTSTYAHEDELYKGSHKPGSPAVLDDFKDFDRYSTAPFNEAKIDSHAKRALQSFKPHAVTDKTACKNCTMSAAMHVMKYVWTKVTEECKKTDVVVGEQEDAFFKPRSFMKKTLTDMDVEHPGKEKWCAFVEVHPKFAYGVLLDKVQPLSLGYMYCLGAKACDAEKDSLETTMSMITAAGDDQLYGVSQTGTKDFPIAYTAPAELEAYLGNVMESMQEKFFSADGEDATEMWKMKKMKMHHKKGHFFDPVAMFFHRISVFMGVEEPPMPPMPLLEEEREGVVDAEDEDIDEDSKGKGKGGKGKGGKGKGGKGKGGKGKGGKGKGKGPIIDPYAMCDDDEAAPESKPFDMVPKFRDDFHLEHKHPHLCKCCYRKLTKKVMQFAVKMVKKLCASDAAKECPYVKGFCAFGEKHPAVAFGIILSKVEPQKYALLPCMVWGGKGHVKDGGKGRHHGLHHGEEFSWAGKGNGFHGWGHSFHAGAVEHPFHGDGDVEHAAPSVEGHQAAVAGKRDEAGGVDGQKEHEGGHHHGPHHHGHHHHGHHHYGHHHHGFHHHGHDSDDSDGGKGGDAASEDPESKGTVAESSVAVGTGPKVEMWI